MKSYINFFENLTAKTPYEEYQKIFHEEVYFKDPFHEFNGLRELYEVFQKLFERLENPRFDVLDFSLNENRLYLKWRFVYALSGKTDSFIGMSEVNFNEGKAISHVDYWDASVHVYEKVPILGFFIRYIRSKIG